MEQLELYLIDRLRLPGKSLKREPTIDSVRPDFVARDGQTLYVIEVKARRATENDVAQLALYRALLEARHPNLKIRPILVSREVPPTVDALLRKIGAEALEPPPQLISGGSYRSRGSASREASRLTGPKSWRVVCRLVQLRTASIRQLALRSNVSYAWAHATVQKLVREGIAAQQGPIVRFLNAEKLLNGVAWERPFEKLRLDTVPSEYDNAFEAARQLTRILKRAGVPFAFTARTSSTLRTGYSRQFKSVDLDLNEDDLGLLGSGGGKVQINVFRPDRPLEELESIQGILMASWHLTLLDTAGLGFSSRDLALELVKPYARE